MRSLPFVSTRAVLSALALIGLTALTTPTAHAQASLTFSGGNNTPFTLSLAAPVTYTITQAGSFSPYFVFDGLGDIFFGSVNPASGSITYSLNGGEAVTLVAFGTGRTGSSLTNDDLLLRNISVSPTFNVGDTVVLSAGTLTTFNSPSASAPSGGLFTTFITSSTGDLIGVAGAAAAAPEPGSIAFLLMGGVGVAGAVVRRKRA